MSNVRRPAPLTGSGSATGTISGTIEQSRTFWHETASVTNRVTCARMRRYRHIAGVVKLADARDSKSRDLRVVRVRPPPPAPQIIKRIVHSRTRRSTRRGRLSHELSHSRPERRSPGRPDRSSSPRRAAPPNRRSRRVPGRLEQRWQMAAIPIRSHREYEARRLDKSRTARDEPRRQPGAAVEPGWAVGPLFCMHPHQSAGFHLSGRTRPRAGHDRVALIGIAWIGLTGAPKRS